VVEFENVSKTYDTPKGQVQAVNGLSMTLNGGETIAFLGPNGAGKSTSLDMLLGLRKPTSGKLTLFGGSAQQAVKKGLVGAMLQSGGLPTDVTVREQIDLWAKLHPRPLPVTDVLKRANILDLEVVAEVGRGDEAVAAAHASDVDVALLDIEMPGLTGLEAADALHRALPAVKIVILTTFGRPGFLRRAMESGASAFLVKDAPVAELVAAIRKVLKGERVIDPNLAAAALAAGENPLTPRERDVLAASADGSTIADIAKRLHLSEGTVRNYLSACIQKTTARNRREAVQAAEARGWLYE
jgi:two-component system response regulator DesR